MVTKLFYLKLEIDANIEPFVENIKILQAKTNKEIPQKGQIYPNEALCTLLPS